jgi:hypothetical protein
MNASTEKRPRLACRVVRGWAAIREGDTEPADASIEASLPPLALRHVAGCAECRLFFAESRSLERALVRGAAGERPAIPEGLNSRIAFAVAQSQPRQARAFPRLAIAACGAAAVLLGLVLFERGFWAGRGDSSVRGDAAEEAQLAAAVKTLPVAFWNSAKPSAVAVWREEPLRKEADALYSDARSAVGFLEANFIPDREVAEEAAPSS